ncbi:tagatose 1,6-diphosphate aldolase [Salinibacter altiplanensis]|uniref:tagatose 1,6-diphosphate aldolase n=1 Tax=Salinibacter altiplanensis TaxID=1803181 RepID=UPI000C9F5168|nr:tagatose 1,6-diphosphate aldolase [Salinibacter altiplanensis]
MQHSTPPSHGKYRRLQRLSDSDGRFSMLAVDQRGSLRRMFGRQHGIDPSEVSPAQLRQVKRIVTRAVAPMASGLLTDPLYGYPASAGLLPPCTGVLLSREQTGYVAAEGQERRSRLLADWAPQRLLASGADALKLLIYHHPDASAETHEHEQDLVASVGAGCEDAGLPFILEVVTYPMGEGAQEAAVQARRRPELVVDAARTFSDPKYQVDVLKLEFPADLKFVADYQDASFGAGEAVYDRRAVEGACERLDQAAAVPWVILSSGVGIDEFVETLRLANEAGASGFLCGRAVWKEIVEHAPDTDEMTRFMEEVGKPRVDRLLTANEGARAWTDHPGHRQQETQSGTKVPTTE